MAHGHSESKPDHNEPHEHIKFRRPKNLTEDMLRNDLIAALEYLRFVKLDHGARDFLLRAVRQLLT
jgi:hypothetical protein